jgi:hypothetical protein
MMSCRCSRKRGLGFPLCDNLGQRKDPGTRQRYANCRVSRARKVYTRKMLVPLSVSSRPSKVKTDIGLSLWLFASIRRLCAAYSRAFSTPSRGGGTSLDQAMLTKTLRPCGIGTGFCVDVTLSAPGCSSFDFMQKPGEGDRLMVTFKGGVISGSARPARGLCKFLPPHPHGRIRVPDAF